MPSLSLAFLVLSATSPASAPGSLGFRDVMHEALRNSPRLTRAQGGVERAIARLKQSRATWLPTVNGVGTLTELDNARVIGDRVVQAQTSLNLSLVLNVPILVPARWLDTYRQGIFRDAADTAAADAERLLALEAGRAFLSLRAEQAALSVAVRARDTSAQQFDLVKKRHQEGVSSRLEEARAERELSDNEGRVAVRQASLVAAREQLLTVIGSRGEGVTFQLDAPVDVPQPNDADPLAILNEPNPVARLGKRADVVAAGERARASRKAVRDSWLDYLPFLTGNLQAFYQNPPTSTLPQTGFQAQLLLNVPLYDGGKRYGDMHEREANALEAEADQRDLALRATGELRALATEVTSRQAALREAQRSAALAEEAQQLARKTFEEGVGTQLDLIDAERTTRDAATAAIVAENAWFAARLGLVLALHGADVLK